ncbi:MAG: hypothetical protein NT132_09575 [Microbacterium sp.]|uniref:hypothetical protein n=1 Tax=Microbacterium sp. TaxID=51671 RepID=UPI00261CF2E5|nr:hypothetical protein [Microbacterium sp.]MCX6502637.1 hypothetical protein [Microbacterium sp.]
MAQSPHPLPADLCGRAFFVAEHPEIPRSRTRASDLWTPVRGVRLPADMHDLVDRCRAHALTLPLGAVFSDATAGRLRMLPLPRRLTDDTLHVTVPHGTRAPRRRDRVHGHSRALEPADCAWLFGIPVTSPSRTYLDLASTLDLRELVAVGDRLLSARDPLAGIADLRTIVAHHSGARGAKIARLALELLTDRAESPKESELRILLIEAGYADLDVNVEVFDDAGTFVARVDLALTRLRIAIEYEGDHHRDRAQWQRDLARRRRLEAVGWTYITVTQTDLEHPVPLLADLAAAVSRASGQ